MMLFSIAGISPLRFSVTAFGRLTLINDIANVSINQLGRNDGFVILLAIPFLLWLHPNYFYRLISSRAFAF
jgi:hypothetical protein